MRFRVQAHAQHLDELRDGLTRDADRTFDSAPSGDGGAATCLAGEGPHNRIQTALVLIPQLCKRLEQEAQYEDFMSRRQSVASHMIGFGCAQPIGDLKPRV